METERVEPVLAATCGAVYKSVTWYERNFAEALAAIEKGQTPQKALLATSTFVDFIYDGVQYKIKVLFTGPERLVIVVNGSENEVSFKKMIDGGILVLCAGKTHSVYCNEDSHITMLSVDSKNCILEKDNDPTKLRSPSPGKLVRYIVEDSCHINIGEAFAEIEVRDF